MLEKELVALKFAQAIVLKEGSLDRNDVIKCFDMASDFLSYETWIKESKKHRKEVAKAEKTRKCSCGRDLKDGQRIYDHGWEYGYECSNCH